VGSSVVSLSDAELEVESKDVFPIALGIEDDFLEARVEDLGSAFKFSLSRGNSIFEYNYFNQYIY
jgi:hypothetical protein